MAGAVPRVGAVKGVRDPEEQRGRRGYPKRSGRVREDKGLWERFWRPWVLQPRVASSHADRPPECLRQPGQGGGFGFPEGEEEESALDRGLRGREAEQCGAPTTSSVCAQLRGSGCRASGGRKAWEERLQSRSYAGGSVQGLRRPMLSLPVVPSAPSLPAC